MPREKVLKIRSVMDPINGETDFSDLKISENAVIETVAEAVLAEQKPVQVLDDNGKLLGSVHCSKMIHILFGKDDVAQGPA